MIQSPTTHSFTPKSQLFIKLLALMLLPFASIESIATMAEATVFVDGRSGPWDISANPTMPYGVVVGVPDKHLGPQVVRGGENMLLEFHPGDAITVQYIGGRPLAGGGGSVFGEGGNGARNWPADPLPCSSAPGCYTGEQTYLAQLIGAFANEKGVVIGSPFIIGNFWTGTVPAGAINLMMGFNDGWYNDNGEGISVKVTVETCAPDDEIQNAYGWSTQRPTYYQWGATLFKQNDIFASFSGKYVRESEPPGDLGRDTCYFEGSAIDPIREVTGGQWLVNASNEWGIDYNGVGTGIIKYYREARRVPCGFDIPQQMQIQCYPGKWQNYGPINLLHYGITDLYIQSSRKPGPVATRRWR